ncbi:MAG: hypothetical protein K8R73_03895 [Clostridiales bacterium]|nr:hypothetical protein [Clostridiales bacterium]
MVIIEVGNRLEVEMQMDERIWEQLLDIQSKGQFVFYFVGGCVRDLCYGIHSRDIDIVFEGDVVELFELLSPELGKKNIQKSNLDTLSIYGDYFEFDLASPRKDEYPSQNGMPKITSATVKEDLSRRDFTVNTGYMEFSDQTIRWFKGESPDLKQIMSKIIYAHPMFEPDIQNRKLRIIHDQSFEEDPSRLLRAVKYMTFLKLELDRESEVFFKVALKERRIERLDKARYMRIIWDYIHFEHADELMNKLHGYNLLPEQHRYKDLVQRIVAMKSKWKCETIDSKVVVFVVMFQEFKEQMKTLGHLLNRIVKEMELIIEGIDGISSGDATKKRYLAYKILYNKKIESITCANLISGDSKWIDLYMTELSHVKIHLTGSDIKRIGIHEGPRIGELKEELLIYKLYENPEMSIEGEIKWIESAKNETGN